MSASAGASTGSAPVRLRTVLCTSGGLYGALVLRRLRACESLEICGVIRSSRVIDPSFGFFQGAWGYLRLSGLFYSLYLWCATTLADWLCALGAIGAVSTRSMSPAPRVFATRDVNDRHGLEFLSDCAPDLLVSAFFNQRLRAPALAVPKLACLNIHPSLLPEHKGVDPVFQALLRRSPLGVTVHFMIPELDAGRILLQKPIEHRAGASVFEITARVYSEGADLLAGAIDRIVQGETGTPQSGAGSYRSCPTRREVRDLRARGGSLVRLSDLVRLLLNPST